MGSNSRMSEQLSGLWRDLSADYTGSTQWNDSQGAVRQDLSEYESRIHEQFTKIGDAMLKVKGQIDNGESIDAGRVKLLHLESAVTDLRLRLVTLKLVSERDALSSDEKNKLELKRKNLEDNRKDISKHISAELEDILDSHHADERYLNDIEKFAKPERELAEALNNDLWFFKAENAPFFEKDPYRKDFTETAGGLKKKRARLRYDWNKLTALKNSLSHEIQSVKPDDKRKTLQNRLEEVKEDLAGIRLQRRQLREGMLEAMLTRSMDVYPHVKADDKKNLDSRFEELQSQYRKLYDYTSSTHNRVSLKRYSSDKIMSPEEVDFRMRLVKAGYNPQDLSPLRLQKGHEVILLRAWVWDFIPWALKNPDLAQFMIDDLSLLVAAINDEATTEEFAKAIDYVSENASQSVLPKDIQGSQPSRTKEFLALADSFRQLYSERKDLLKEWNLTELRDRFNLERSERIEPSSRQNGIRAFIENLTYLRQRSNNLQRRQVEGAIQRSGHYQKVVERSLLKSTMQRANKQVKRRLPIRIKPRLHLNFRQWGQWTKKIFVDSSWTEKGLRATSLGIATLGGALFVGGGIALSVLTVGIGAAGGAALIAAGGGVFVALYSTINNWIDDWVEWKERDTEKIGKKHLAKLYINEMKASGVIPDYGEAKLKTRSEKKRAKSMAETIMEELKLPKHRNLLPEDYIAAFKDYIRKNYPSENAFQGEKSDVSIYAINYAIENLLTKKIKESIDNIKWEDPGVFKSQEVIMKERLERMGF